MLVRWYAVHDHDVDGQCYAIADPTDQRIVSQAGNKEAGSARGCVCLGPVQSFADRLCRVDALAKKQVRPRVDEERGSLLLRRRANGRDPPRLPVDVVEARALDNPVGLGLR